MASEEVNDRVPVLSGAVTASRSGSSQINNNENERDITPTVTEGSIDLEKGDDIENYDDSDPTNHVGVDVDYAKLEFEGLRRRFSQLSRTASRVSHTSNKLSKTWTRHSRRDIDEILAEENDSQFDVEGVLRDRKKQMDEEQMRPKNIGWSNHFHC